MSHHSPPSSAGLGPSSSPYGGTDPTLYSPDLVRNTHSGNHGQGINPLAALGAKHHVGSLSPKWGGTLPLPVPYFQGAFVNELNENDVAFISRFQFITKLPDGISAGSDSEFELFSIQHQMKLYQCFASCVPLYTRGVHLRYDNLRDAAEGMAILTEHGFLVEYISGYQYAVAKAQDTSQINEFEGQIKLPVIIEANPNDVMWSFTPDDLVEVCNTIQVNVADFGTVRNCFHVETNQASMKVVFRIEFHSVDASTRAVQSLRTDTLWGFSTAKTFKWMTDEPSLWCGERPRGSPHRTMPRVDDKGRIAGYRAANNNDPFAGEYVSTVRFHPADQHNRVRRERILDGSDVRTTIMLRNIPNKMDWLSLKATLDEVCFGTYDFMYLRIDFKSGCNVGYAFINFADVSGMIALIDRIERRCWLGYRSAKAAEISYATIQGREALVQKFRNSSVMQETPFCRPRLFLTYHDADLFDRLRYTSTEQSFPRPDNLSKLQRSMDSARSVGLYPPHGVSGVSEHRNRDSAYDRGTPRDMAQAASNYARQRATPMAPHSLDQTQQRDIELWYSVHYGQGQVGYIPFQYIPLTHVRQYLSQVLASPIGGGFPGVIGGPSMGSPYHVNNSGYVATTPSRGRRSNGSPRSARRGNRNGRFV